MSILRDEHIKMKDVVQAFRREVLNYERHSSESEALKAYLKALEALKEGTGDCITTVEERLENLERAINGKI